jgi:hypothetical protein
MQQDYGDLLRLLIIYTASEIYKAKIDHIEERLFNTISLEKLQE